MTAFIDHSCAGLASAWFQPAATRRSTRAGRSTCLQGLEGAEWRHCTGRTLKPMISWELAALARGPSHARASWGRPLGTGVQVGGRGVYLWSIKSSQPASGGSWQSVRAVLVDHRYTPRHASDPSWCPCSALGSRPLAGAGAYLWSPGAGPFGPLGPPGVGVGVWATIGRVEGARWASRFWGAPLGGRDSESRLYLGLNSVSGGS